MFLCPKNTRRSPKKRQEQQEQNKINKKSCNPCQVLSILSKNFFLKTVPRPDHVPRSQSPILYPRFTKKRDKSNRSITRKTRNLVTPAKSCQSCLKNFFFKNCPTSHHDPPSRSPIIFPKNCPTPRSRSPFTIPLT